MLLYEVKEVIDRASSDSLAKAARFGVNEAASASLMSLQPRVSQNDRRNGNASADADSNTTWMKCRAGCDRARRTSLPMNG